MKKNYILTFLLFLFFLSLKAQTVTVSGNCDSQFNGVYNLASDVNGRPSYFRNASGFDFSIQWTGTRWQIITTTDSVGPHNDTDTPNPPASTLSTWVGGECSPVGTFSGDGTSTTTLSVTDLEPFDKKIKLYPNPTTDFIQIFGLISTRKYSIFDIHGSEIKKGTISYNEKLYVKNMINGLYFLILDTGNTIKFIKK